MKIKELKSDYRLLIHKINRTPVAELDSSVINKISRDISDTDVIELTIPKFIVDKNNTFKNILFTPYLEIKEERLISLDEEEFFVIKKVKESKSSNTKSVTAYSLEYKLAKNDIKLEDIGLYIFGSDEEKGIYSLNDYMQKETGWKFGHVDESVLRNEKGEEKLRWQESVNTNWHSFLTDNVKEAWGCHVVFDTKNKVVNLYDINNFGDTSQICLSYDNYLKKLETTGSTEDIVTRLNLVGNEETNILEATPTGYPYIENYSYFIENDEMSKELKKALLTYSEMIEKRTVIWNDLRNKKATVSKNLQIKKTELSFLYSEINNTKSMIQSYKLNNDTENVVRLQAELTKLNDKKVILDNEVIKLEEEIVALNEGIKNINVLCKRETCTDDDGNLVFNKNTLEELKDYIYYDTYSNDCFLRVEDLIEAGQRILNISCRPTTDWVIDSINFKKKILNNRYNFKGEMSLGNLIILYDSEKDIEYFTYFVGFEQDFKTKELNLTISNKKFKNDNRKVIGDLLYTAKKAMKEIGNNRYLWVQQKKNRMNLPYRKGIDERGE